MNYPRRPSGGDGNFGKNTGNIITTTTTTATTFSPVKKFFIPSTSGPFPVVLCLQFDPISTAKCTCLGHFLDIFRNKIRQTQHWVRDVCVCILFPLGTRTENEDEDEDGDEDERASEEWGVRSEWMSEKGWRSRVIDFFSKCQPLKGPAQVAIAAHSRVTTHK